VRKGRGDILRLFLEKNTNCICLRIFVDLESIRDPQLSSKPLSFDTLEGLQICYPSHYDLSNCQLYPPGNQLPGGNLVSHILRTCTGDCEGISWHLGWMLDHASQSIPGGCFRVRVALTPVIFSSVNWCNYPSH
jgi:hypothetical protein